MESQTQRGGTPAEPLPEDLAAEYLSLRAEGEKVDEQSYLALLSGHEARAAFKEMIAGAERVQRSLPRPIVKETVLKGRYRILDEIGSGGMGRVFAAIDTELQRKVAIKVLSSLGAGNAEREELFLKESRLLAALQHPNIVAVHEAGRDGDLSFIVMDLVDGTSLADVIERARRELEKSASGQSIQPRDGRLLERAIEKKLLDGRPNLIDARDWNASMARIMLELARTLEAAHGQRVIHRDLKPGNVMLLGGGSPVVLDFGLAGNQDLKAGTVTQGLYGSVAYLAPEQARTQQVGMDPRTDVYQLGLILYELLTLCRTFPGHAIGEILERIQNGDYKAPRAVNPNVPSDLEAICMMCLEVNPDRRYATAKALREDLDRYIEGKEAPIAARSSKWRSVVRKSRYYGKKHPVAVGLAGMIVVGLIVGRVAMGWVDAAPAFLTGFRVPPGGAELTPIQNGQPVSRDDSLGVTVNASEPQFLYVLSIFRHADNQRYFAPMHPALLEEYRKSIRTNTALVDPLDWGFRVPACLDTEHCTSVICTHVEESNTVEGLFVFASPEERPDFESWLACLHRRPQGCPEAEAMELFTKPDTMRGGSVRSLPAAELARRYGQVKIAIDAPDENFELPNLRRLKLECPVGSAK